MADFQLEGFTQRSGQLLERTREIFSRYGDLIGEVSTVPTSMRPSDGAIKLVFVGQYSAGKSSIIKMLSGIDTKIGAAITTDQAKSYPWGDLEIVDTPGIHTGVRADHDERAYYQIDHAALLIFVVTNEGFDDYIGKHFRKLAVEQKRGKNMVLVVNKMDRSALGNVPEQQQIITDDLRKVIQPYSPEDLYLSFLSTDMYFEGVNESDRELRDIYLEQSGHDQFVGNLNRFVASRGVLSKVQAPLETLKKSITNVVGDSNNMIEDIDLDAVEEILKRKTRELEDGKRQIRLEIESLADTCANKIRAEGSKAAGVIQPGATEEQVNKEIETGQLQAEIYVNECERVMVERLRKVCENVDQELLAIDRSQLSIKIRTKFDLPVPVSKDIDNAKNILAIHSGLEKIETTSKGASKMGMTLPMLGEMNFAEIVKDVGHLFGVKFAPWGAVKIVANAAKVLGWIGIALTAYQVLDKVFGTDKVKEMNDAIRAAQSEVTRSFDDAAIKTRASIIAAATSAMGRLTAPIVRDAEEKLEQFRQRKDRLKELNRELGAVLVDVDALMEDVQRTAKA